MQVAILIPQANSLLQPIVRALCDLLASRAQVIVLCPQFASTGALTTHLMPQQVRTPAWKARARLKRWILERRASLGVRMLPHERFSQSHFNSVAVAELAESARAFPNAELIAVDSLALLACQELGRKAHFVSLELLAADLALQMVRPESVHCCMTQNELRATAIFPNNDVRSFIVPNFPHYIPRKSGIPHRTGELVVAGTLYPGFGAELACEVLALDPSLRFTFLGGYPPASKAWMELRHRHLFESGRIVVSQVFLNEEDYVAALEPFEAGLTLYDLRLINNGFYGRAGGILPWSAFNYISGFPGKIGMCMNAGVPVITSSLPGTDFVVERGVGVAAYRMTATSVLDALEEIRRAGPEMRERCLQLAQDYSFDKCAAPFVNFVLSQGKAR